MCVCLYLCVFTLLKRENAGQNADNGCQTESLKLKGKYIRFVIKNPLGKVFTDKQSSAHGCDGNTASQYVSYYRKSKSVLFAK